MKAYKATYNFKCRNQLYEVGKTYNIEYNQVVREALRIFLSAPNN